MTGKGLFYNSRMPLNVSDRFRATAQVFSEKFFCDRKKVESVFWTSENKSIVGIKDVL